MTLSPEAVAAYKKLLENPKDNGFDFLPLNEVFEVTEVSIAKHLLYDQYLKVINRTREHLPKVIFYIIMDDIYNQKKADDGNLGYCVQIRESLKSALNYGTGN